MYAEGPPNEEFDRSFVLFLLATILAPVHMEHVPISYYSLVKYVSRIKKYELECFYTEIFNGQSEGSSL
jgi:hypothetical protein